MDSQGFITISRKLLEWEWIDDAGMVSLWLQLLLRANHEQKVWHGITVGRGQLITSVLKLQKYTGMTRQQVRSRLDNLVNSQQITIKATNKYTMITICKYDTYQSIQEGEQPASQPAVQPSNNHQITTNNNEEQYISSSTSTREEGKFFKLDAYAIVDKQNIPKLGQIWIEEIQILIKRQLGIRLTVEDIKKHYSEYIVQEVNEVTQVTYQDFRQHFNNYVRKREQIKQQEKQNGNSTTNKAGYDRLRAAEVRAVSPKDYETTF